MAPDYCAQAQKIAADLFEHGKLDWTARTEDAIAGGSTATEILMRVRFTRRELLASGAASHGEDSEARSLIR